MGVRRDRAVGVAHQATLNLQRLPPDRYSRFGWVLADAGYGLSAPFRQGLSERGLTWAVGIPFKQKVYPAGVSMVSYAVPAVPSLVGGSVYAQALIVPYPYQAGLSNLVADVLVQ